MSEKMITVGIGSQEKLASDVYSMVLSVGELAKEIRPGQFINVYSDDQAHLLPRPISICEADIKNGHFALSIVLRAKEHWNFQEKKLGGYHPYTRAFGQWLYFKKGKGYFDGGRYWNTSDA